MNRKGITPARLLLPVLLLSLSAHGSGPGRTDKGERAVMVVVNQLFDGMRQKDPGKMQAVFAEGATLGSTPVADFIASIVSSSAHLDEVTFDETIRVDQNLAMAWTPYNLFVDGVFHHCGVDLFVLKRSPGEGWLIHQLEDTRRTDHCDSERRQ